MHFTFFCKAYHFILFLQHFLNIVESVFKKSQLGLTSSQIFHGGASPKLGLPLVPIVKALVLVKPHLMNFILDKKYIL
jgi:hypothetical protein